ncbi:MAG: phosphatase PAP2 family protein [Dehalococcoidia bacterium]
MQSLIEVAREAARIGRVPTRRNVLHWLSWAITLAGILILTAVVAGGDIFDWEEDLTRELQSVDYPGWALKITSSNLEDPLTWEGALIWAAIVALFALRRWRLEAALAALALPLHVLGNFPKAVVDRPRPSELFDGITGVGGDMSFASGHAEFVITFFGFVAYVAFIRLKSVVALVGIGRINDGHHWPLDVLGGYIVGIGLLSGLIWLRTSFHQALADSD